MAGSHSDNHWHLVLRLGTTQACLIPSGGAGWVPHVVWRALLTYTELCFSFHAFQVLIPCQWVIRVIISVFMWFGSLVMRGCHIIPDNTEYKSFLGPFQISLIFVPWGPFGSKSSLFQVMAWCLMAPSHYLNQYWPSYVMYKWRHQGDSVSCSMMLFQIHVVFLYISILFKTFFMGKFFISRKQKN